MEVEIYLAMMLVWRAAERAISFEEENNFGEEDADLSE